MKQEQSRRRLQFKYRESDPYAIMASSLGMEWDDVGEYLAQSAHARSRPRDFERLLEYAVAGKRQLQECESRTEQALAAGGPVLKLRGIGRSLTGTLFWRGLQLDLPQTRAAIAAVLCGGPLDSLEVGTRAQSLYEVRIEAVQHYRYCVSRLNSLGESPCGVSLSAVRRDAEEAVSESEQRVRGAVRQHLSAFRKQLRASGLPDKELLPEGSRHSGVRYGEEVVLHLLR